MSHIAFTPNVSNLNLEHIVSHLLNIPSSPRVKEELVLKISALETPLGPMVAIANDDALYLLEFGDQHNLEWRIKRLSGKLNCLITSGETKPIIAIQKELKAYFEGKLTTFKTPLFFLGSPFQKQVWGALQKIPYGETRSYAEQAQLIGKASAFRAVANANGANPLAIIIPCHRVIRTNGDLGGYGAGIERKKWLLSHEKKLQKDGF